MDELKGELLPFIKEHGVALGFGVVGLICLGYGLIMFSIQQSPQTDNDFQPSQEKVNSVQSPITAVPKQIATDIEGAVMKPGVYTLPATSRTQDALIAADGLSQNADRQQVAQQLNLAASLAGDGAKLYIPAVGEQVMTSENSSNSSSGIQADGSKSVNINQATESDLDALPGVGPVTAQKIIDNRPYQSV